MEYAMDLLYTFGILSRIAEQKSDGSLVVQGLGCGFWWNEAEKRHKPLLTAEFRLLKTSTCAIPIFCSCSVRRNTVPCKPTNKHPQILGKTVASYCHSVQLSYIAPSWLSQSLITQLFRMHANKNILSHFVHA